MTITLAEIKEALNAPTVKFTLHEMKRPGAILLVKFNSMDTFHDVLAKFNKAFPGKYRLFNMDKQMVLNTEEEVIYFKLIANDLV